MVYDVQYIHTGEYICLGRIFRCDLICIGKTASSIEGIVHCMVD